MANNVKIGFNKNFKEFNSTKKRYRVAKGSAGSGKSVNIAQDYILKLGDKKYKGCNLLVVRKVGESNQDSTYAELISAIMKIYGNLYEYYWQITTNPLKIKNKLTGNSIIFRGMKDERQVEKVKSITFKNGKLTWIWVEEATELNEKDVDILDDRLRGKLTKGLYYQITLSFNPISATHWIKKKFFDYKDDFTFLHQSTYLENRFIDEAYHLRMMRRKEQDPDGYKVYGLGEWGELGGLILHNCELIDFKKNNIDLLQFDNRGYSQDFGFNHANVILEVGEKDNCLYINQKIYEYERDTDEIIRMCEQKNIRKNDIMICDSAEPDRIKTFVKAGYKAKGVKKFQGSVNAQIDKLKKYHKIYIDVGSVMTWKESQQWKWKKNKDGNYIDEPVAFFDDAMACLRYSTDLFDENNKWGW